MTEYLNIIGLVIGTVTGVIVAIRKIIQFSRPIKITTSVRMVFDDSGSDAIHAKIVNNSGGNIFIEDCHAREVKSPKRILISQLQNELFDQRNYKHMRFDVKSYDLMKTRSLKLEPDEVIELTHKLNFKHPLAGFFCGEYVIQVKLSNGRTFYSNRLKVPKKWLFKSRNQKNHNKSINVETEHTRFQAINHVY